MKVRLGPEVLAAEGASVAPRYDLVLLVVHAFISFFKKSLPAFVSSTLLFGDGLVSVSCVSFKATTQDA